MTTRTTERDLIIPAALALSALVNRNDDDVVSSNEFRSTLMRMIEPTLTEEDKVKLPSCPSRRIDQVVRNLISNRTLDNMGYTYYNADTRSFTVFDSCLEKASDIALQIKLYNRCLELEKRVA